PQDADALRHVQGQIPCSDADVDAVAGVGAGVGQLRRAVDGGGVDAAGAGEPVQLDHGGGVGGVAAGGAGGAGQQAGRCAGRLQAGAAAGDGGQQRGGGQASGGGHAAGAAHQALAGARVRSGHDGTDLGQLVQAQGGAGGAVQGAPSGPDAQDG